MTAFFFFFFTLRTAFVISETKILKEHRKSQLYNSVLSGNSILHTFNFFHTGGLHIVVKKLKKKKRIKITVVLICFSGIITCCNPVTCCIHCPIGRFECLL